MRVHNETHARLVELSKAAGATLIETLEEATEALWRKTFADRVRGEYAEMTADPAEWADYMAESESTEIGDGVAR